jgi:hypothetical protein
MVISVDTYEQREVVRTYIDGRVIEVEEVTRIYVVEPMETTSLSRRGGGVKPAALDPTDADEVKIRSGRIGTWLIASVLWTGWIWWEFG